MAVKNIEQLARDVDFHQRLIELDAISKIEEENLSWQELTTILGCEWDAEKQMPKDVTTLANACLNSQTNEKVKKLPTQERLRVIKTSVDALSSILGRGK